MGFAGGGGVREGDWSLAIIGAKISLIFILLK